MRSKAGLRPINFLNPLSGPKPTIYCCLPPAPFATVATEAAAGGAAMSLSPPSSFATASTPLPFRPLLVPLPPPPSSSPSSSAAASNRNAEGRGAATTSVGLLQLHRPLNGPAAPAGGSGGVGGKEV